MCLFSFWGESSHERNIRDSYPALTKASAKIHLENAKSKDFAFELGFTMGFCGIFVFSGTKKTAAVHHHCCRSSSCDVLRLKKNVIVKLPQDSKP